MIEQIVFPKDVEVGKYYKVPCIKSSDGKYWPVNSHLHEDKKVIGFIHRHWHIDWRFISIPIWEEEIAKYGSKSINEAKLVIIYDPKGDSVYSNTYNANSEKITYRRLLCKRHYATASFWDDYPSGQIEWTLNMHKKFSCAKLKEQDGRLICPHKGIEIDKNCKDAQGNYVCPGHLLRFNPETLKCVEV